MLFRSVEELVGRRDEQGAYRTEAYLLRREVNLSLKEITEEFGVSLSRISKIRDEIEKGIKRESKLHKLSERYKVKY